MLGRNCNLVENTPVEMIFFRFDIFHSSLILIGILSFNKAPFTLCKLAIFCMIQIYMLNSFGQFMALTPKQIAILVKLRALGWSQSEIAEKLDTSQQVVGYQLKKLKDQSMKKGTDEVFNAALIGGLAGAATSIGLVALLEYLKNSGGGK